MKKLLVLLMTAACALCLALGLAACMGDNGHVHKYGELVPEKPATCTEEGFEAHYFCEECQTYFDAHKHEISPEDLKIDIDPAAHNYGELVPQVDAQCEVAGTKAYYHCENCGKYFDDQKVEKQFDELNIPAKKHNYGQLVPQVDAQCEVAGMKAHYHCENCGKYFDDKKVEKQFNELTIPAKNHNYGELVPEQPATCTEEGMQAYYHCVDCNKYFNSRQVETDYEDLKINVDPTAHNYGQIVPQVDARCEVAGTKAHYHCENCGSYFDDKKVETDYENLNIPAKGHNYGELVPEQPATCTEGGMQAYYHCEDCGKYFDRLQVKTDYEDLKIEVNPVAHRWGSDGKCLLCQKQRTAYELGSDGTKIYMGEYPQSEVEESGLKATLGWEAGNGTLPTADDAHGWTDYNYYIEGEVQSYMWYIDVEYENVRYRGVYFTSYRPYYTISSTSTGNSHQDDNGYEINTVYWFKYEPIEWRILEQKDGTALLMSNIILDSQQYYRTDSGTRTMNGDTVYPNNYKESDIRAWLNDTFYETAFDEYAQEIIETTTVDNSASTTGSLSNQYACWNTQDKVFLLSYKEAATTSSSGLNPTTRQLKSTDYAKSQGVCVYTVSSYRGNGWWWLRSPYGYNSGRALFVNYTGYFYDSGCSVIFTDGGVVPALRIKL